MHDTDAEWQFTQKQEWRYFSNCSLSQIPWLLAGSRMDSVANMAPVERLSPSWAGSGGALGCRDFTHLPSSFKRLVRTRWHCNNTCYITWFRYQKPPPEPVELSWSAVKLVFSFICSFWILVLYWQMNAVIHMDILLLSLCVTSSPEPFWTHNHASDVPAQTGLQVVLSVIIGLYSALLKLSDFVTSVVIPSL